MIEKNDNLQNARRRAPLHASLRFVIALILQSGMVYYFTHGGALGANDYDFHTGLNQFLLAGIPTVTVLFLLPVIIRGSFSAKTHCNHSFDLSRMDRVLWVGCHSWWAVWIISL